MSAIELVASLLGLVCVVLVVRRSIANYAFGIASTALFAGVFFDQKLYSDALLQLFFVVINAYGWINWRRAQLELGDVRVESMRRAARLAWGFGGLAATIAWGSLMHRFTDASYPFADAAIAIASVIAQLLMARRAWENWLIWIAVDVASIPLYLAKELWVTAALYAVYLALALWGYVDWRRVRHGEGPAIA